MKLKRRWNEDTLAALGFSVAQKRSRKKDPNQFTGFFYEMALLNATVERPVAKVIVNIIARLNNSSTFVK